MIELNERYIAVNSGSIFPEIPDADKKLCEICEEAVSKKYGTASGVPECVSERLSTELGIIEKNGYAKIYLHYASVIQKCDLQPAQYGLKGLGASSLVAYLLGLSKTDSMSEECPLYYELFAGIDGDREPTFTLTIDETAWKQVRTLFADWGHGDEESFSYGLWASKQRAFLYRVESSCGITPDGAAIRQPEVLQEIGALVGRAIAKEEKAVWEDILSFVTLRSFSDLVKVLSMVHGTGVWEENGKDLLIDGTVTIDELIANREDLYEMLLRHGMPKKTAYKITEAVRKGRMCDDNHKEFEEEMHRYGLPDWAVDSCKKTKYLFSRAHGAEHAEMLLRLAYYEKNYPDEFDALHQEMYGE